MTYSTDVAVPRLGFLLGAYEIAMLRALQGALLAPWRLMRYLMYYPIRKFYVLEYGGAILLFVFFVGLLYSLTQLLYWRVEEPLLILLSFWIGPIGTFLLGANILEMHLATPDPE